MAVLALGILAFTMRAAGQVRPLSEHSHTDNAGHALTPGGRVNVDLREVQTEIEGSKGPIALSVLVIFDPKSRAYSWWAHRSNPADPSWRSKQFNEEQAAFLKDGGFADFMALPGPLRLLVRPPRGHASDLEDAAKKSLEEASRSLDPLGDLQASQGVHVVPLLALGRDFTSSPMSVTLFDVMPTVTNVQWDGKHWTVTLKARWTEEIILDSDFKVISMRRVGN
jgi:hypothetical protein